MKKFIALLFCLNFMIGCSNSNDLCALNKKNIQSIKFPSESINEDQNTFQITGDKGSYKFSYNLNDVYISYHKIGIDFPDEDYYSPQTFNKISKLSSKDNSKIPSLKFNTSRRIYQKNGLNIVDSLILAQHDTMDQQIRRYIIIITEDYNIEIDMCLHDHLVKSVIFQEPQFFILDQYDLSWDTKKDAIELFATELRNGKEEKLISGIWYNETELLLNKMIIK